MTRAMLSSTILGLLVLAAAAPGEAQSRAPRPAPHEGMHAAEAMSPTLGAQVGNPAAGKRLFQSKGCAACHAIKGQGGTTGPDLGRMDHTHNVYQMAGIMWNHAARVQEAMVAQRLDRPQFRGREMADLLAYLHTLDVLGDAEKGRAVFEQKRCSRCHSVNGEGGNVGPPLVPSHHPHAPIELVGVMWNHSPTMTAMMEALKVPRPVFEGNEMADLLAYLEAAQHSASPMPMHEPHSPMPHPHR